MGYQRQTTMEVRANLAEQLDWRFAGRSDPFVAQALVSGAAGWLFRFFARDEGVEPLAKL